MRLMDLPRNYGLRAYEESIEKVVNRLKVNPNVISIYQVGSVSTPGISDVDLWVVFEDGAEIKFNPRAGLSDVDYYIFIHDLFGLCESHFYESLNFSFFHDFKLLYGKDLQLDAQVHSGKVNDLKFVERQAALEYIIKAYQVCTVEKAFGVIKVRNFLLHTKALLLDLEPLGLDDSSYGLKEIMNDILELRNQWFETKNNSAELIIFYEFFYSVLGDSLVRYFKENKLWYPFGNEINMGSNIRINHGAEFAFESKGVRFPSLFNAMHRRIFNLQRRLMSFNFQIPTVSDPPDTFVQSRFDFICKALGYNNRYLPYFIPVPYGLTLFNLEVEGK